MRTVTMTRLSPTDKQKVSDALTDCARRTKDIDNPSKLADEAYSILSAKLGDNPGLFKAACQVYNSCKSIHKLSEASDDTRGNTFAILDVQDMTKRLQNEKNVQLRKAAAAPATFRKVQPITGAGMSKVASSTDRNTQDRRPQAPKVSLNEFKQYLREELTDIEEFLHKSAGILSRATSLRDEAVDSFVAAFAVEPTSLRKDAAARLVANYGDSAKRLIEAFADKRPLSKLASADYEHKYVGTPALPQGTIHTLAKEAMSAMSDYSRAGDDYTTIINTMAENVVDYAKTYMSLRKKADAGTVVVGAGALKGLNEMLGLDDGDDAKGYKDDIFTTEMINNMMAHSYQRAFMRAATQSAISKYALDKIVGAFNRAVSKLPANSRMVPATANQSLIEGMMIDELAKGAVPSKADTEVIATLANTIGKLQSDKGIYRGNETNAQ